jgi:uncharacterized spore protein YtfJ
MYNVGSGWGGRRLEATEGGMGGGGGGGAVIALPVGVLEVTPERVHFERFNSVKRAGILVSAGFLLGLALGAFRSSK